MAERKYLALVGNPNSGKTLIFNNLTGGHQHVGNWPGVTVEKKEGHMRGDKSIFYVDLPGTYSLSPYSPEEVVVRKYLTSEKPELVLNVVDASNLERNLYLTTQLLETGHRTVIMLNMMDIAEGRGIEIDADALSKELGVPVVPSVATKREQTHATLDHILSLAGIDHISIHKKGKKNSCPSCSSATCATRSEENCATRSEETASAPSCSSATCATRSEETVEENVIAPSSTIDRPKPLKIFSPKTENTLADVEKIIKNYCPQERLRHYAVKALEKDSLTLDELSLTEEDGRTLNHLVSEFEEDMNDDTVSIISSERYAYIEKLLAKTVTARQTDEKSASEKIDRVVTNKFLAFPIFVAIMFLVYYISISTVGAIVTDFTNDKIFGEWVPTFFSAGLDALNAPEWVSALVIDGIVGGVGAVIGFVPQIMVLFALLSFLEDSGYMARIAFILDRLLRAIGLSGKSIIPVMIGTGCGVPGIMASRSIENEADRKIAVITTTFIPCSAKLPVIALISGALFGNAWWVAASAYFLGIFAIIVSAVTLKKMRLFRRDVSPFVMELPDYHMPRQQSVLLHMWDKGKMFIKRAGTFILASCVLIWFLSSFDFSLNMVAADDSILAVIGSKIAVVFQPLGFDDWRAATASITGLLAKENLVGTFGILYGVASEVTETGTEFWANLRAAYAPLAGYSLLVFNLLCSPCVAAIGTMYREFNSVRWTLFAAGYQTFFAYCVALVIYQFGLIATGGGFTVWTAVAILLVLRTIYALAKRQKPNEEIGFGIHGHLD